MPTEKIPHSSSDRAASTTSGAESSLHSEVSSDPKGRGPFGESLADAPTTSDSVSYGSNQQFTALRAAEATRLAELVSEPQCATIFKRRAHAQERRLNTTARTGLNLWRTS